MATTDFLLGYERDLIKQDVLDITTDEQIRGTIIYRSFVGAGTFSPLSGSISSSYYNQWISVMRTPLYEQEVEIGLVPSGVKTGASEARPQVGNYKYLIPVEVLATVTTKDRIIDGTSERYVIDYETDSLGIYHTVLVRNLTN